MKYSRLVILILRHGTLQSREENINNTRARTLSWLIEFVPEGRLLHSLTRSCIFENIIGQLAFVRNSFRVKGGHLSGRNVSYVRIPKAANTSMSKSMLVNKYPNLKNHIITEAEINFLADVNMSTEIHGTPIFTVVRNPFSRLVSVYRDFFENKKNEFGDYLFGVLKTDLSFAGFVDRISVIPDRLKDPHIKPQHLILRYYDGKKIPVKVLKLEDQLGLKQFLTDFSLPLFHLNRGGDPYDYRTYYNSSLEEKVRAMYAADFHRFGYETKISETKERSNAILIHEPGMRPTTIL